MGGVGATEDGSEDGVTGPGSGFASEAPGIAGMFRWVEASEKPPSGTRSEDGPMRVTRGAGVSDGEGVSEAPVHGPESTTVC